MSNPKTRQIKCLIELFEYRPELYEEIARFLHSDKVIDNETLSSFGARDNDKAQYMQEVLALLYKKDKMLMLHYEWNVLPKQYISLEIVTDMSRKCFVYEEN